MVTISNYKKVESLEEAWQLNQKSSNRIIGGMLWIRLASYHIETAVDLSGLGLDTIEEDDEAFSIGCMVTLRQLELHPGLAAHFQGAVREAVRHIVGVQFRNLATVGGSVFGRYGFSDVLTVLLSMDSYVELYRGGILPLREFVTRKYDRDILVRVILKKEQANYYYQSVRLTQTDFPVLTCGAAAAKEGIRLAIGARPGRAMLVTDEAQILQTLWTEERIDAFAEWAAKRVPTQGNMRGSAEYRSHLVKVLVKRALNHFKEDRSC